MADSIPRSTNTHTQRQMCNNNTMMHLLDYMHPSPPSACLKKARVHSYTQRPSSPGAASEMQTEYNHSNPTYMTLLRVPKNNNINLVWLRTALVWIFNRGEQATPVGVFIISFTELCDLNLWNKDSDPDDSIPVKTNCDFVYHQYPQGQNTMARTRRVGAMHGDMSFVFYLFYTAYGAILSEIDPFFQCICICRGRRGRILKSQRTQVRRESQSLLCFVGVDMRVF